MARRPFPYNEDGSTYGYNGQGERVCTGAKMGRSNVNDEDPETGNKLNLRRVPIDPYDGGGAYWGFGEPLFCAWNRERTVVIYVRASSRAKAIEAILEERPNDLIS